MTKERRTITVSYTLYPEQVQAIQALAKDDHEGMKSRALRQIIDEWVEHTHAAQTHGQGQEGASK
jgi:hypothetical protein